MTDSVYHEVFARAAADPLAFWAEAAALWSFGIAWFVAGKAFRVIADPAEQLTFAASAARGTPASRS